MPDSLSRSRIQRPWRKAFSLVELLLVMTVIGVLLALAAPSFVTSTATRLGTTGSEMRGLLSQAQQRAILSGRPVEVRFYRCDPEVGEAINERAFRACQLYSIDEEGRDRPDERVFWFSPPYVIIPEPRLTTFSDLPETFDPEFLADRATYVAFRFLADGSTDLDKENTDQWYFTFAAEHDGKLNQTPDNFITLQIDPMSGAIRSYRP